MGEAVTDVAIKLKIRKSIQGGQTDLAIAESLVVVVSSLLAYWSQRRPGSDESRASFFILAWFDSQGVRLALVHLLEPGGAAGYVVLAVLMFLDKWTGPLGILALDVALR